MVQHHVGIELMIMNNERDKKMKLRKETIDEINYSIGGLMNLYLDNPNEEPITLQDAIDYVYNEIIDNAESNRFGLTTAIKFDGKNNIMDYIKNSLLEEKDTIKFKDLNQNKIVLLKEVF